MYPNRIASVQPERNAASENGKLIPAIGYLRASTEKQETSCSEQKDHILAAVAGQYKIVDWYIDDGVSGWKEEERRGFQSAISHACKGTGGAKVIIVWKQNRFSRLNAIDFTPYLSQLRKNDAALYTLDAGLIDPTNLGDLVSAIVRADQDNAYCRNLSSDVHRGMKRLAEEGYWLRPAPLGYGLEGPYVAHKGFKLCIEESEAKIVRYIFSLFLDGLTTNKIAVKLNQENVKTCSVIRDWRKRKGYADVPASDRPYVCDKWNPTTVNQVLKNEVYIGTYRWGARCESAFHDFGHDMVFRQDNHACIVSKMDFARVQKILAGRARCRRKQSRDTDTKAILGGLVRCGFCKESDRQGVMHKIGNASESTYGCTGVKTGCCCGNRVSVDEVLGIVVPEIVRYFQSDSIRERLRSQLMEYAKPSDSIGLDSLQESLKEKQDALQRAYRNVALCDTSSIGIIELVIAELKAEISVTERKLKNAAKPDAEIEEDVDAMIEEALRAYDDLQSAFDEGDYGRIRLLLEECVSEIVVFSERERGVLPLLWESLPKDGTFTVDDITKESDSRRQVGNQINKLVHQGTVEVVKGRGGKGPGIYRRLDKAPSEPARTNYRLVRGSVKLQRQVVANLTSEPDPNCKVSDSVSLEFNLDHAV